MAFVNGVKRLTIPLVSAMGQHDPLDGLITYQELQEATPPASEASTWPDLSQELVDMATLCAGRNWGTDDPLGLGGLLADAYRLQQRFDRALDAYQQALTHQERNAHAWFYTAFLLLTEEVGEMDGTIVFANATPSVMQVISLLNIDQFLKLWFDCFAIGRPIQI